MSKKSFKIIIVTSTRADYGLLRPLIKRFSLNKKIHCIVAVTGTHLSSEFGSTINEIESDKFEDIEKIEISLSADTPSATSKSLALTTLGFADLFSKQNPDLLLLLGDRFEVFGVAQTAVIFNIPIAHIHGGEITSGAIDDSFRHAISKMSNLHFTSSHDHMKRVIQLGENPNSVFNVGALAVESILGVKKISKSQIQKKLNFSFNKRNFLLCYHPVTKQKQSQAHILKRIIESLLKVRDSSIFISYPNSDTNFYELIKVLKDFHNKFPNRICLQESFGQLIYFNLMRNMDFIIGNSSSGIIEAPYFHIPTINIGDRQKGRSHPASVIHSSDSRKALSTSIDKALALKSSKKLMKIDQIFGTGQSSNKIYKEILLALPHISSMKNFYNIKH